MRPQSPEISVINDKIRPMKITSLPILFFLLASLPLFAQTPQPERDRLHQDQTTLQSSNLQLEDMEEKRARLAEAISDGDLESSIIMKQEVLAIMEREVKEGSQWVQNGTYPPLERMKAILESFRQLELDQLGADKARQAENLVFEFSNLMGRAPY